MRFSHKFQFVYICHLFAGDYFASSIDVTAIFPVFYRLQRMLFIFSTLQAMKIWYDIAFSFLALLCSPRDTVTWLNDFGLTYVRPTGSAFCNIHITV